MDPRGCGEVRGASRDSQVGNARFTDGGGDGFDGRAEGVEELRELPAPLRPPALLHHEAGHGDDIGVESRAVRHGGGVCARGGQRRILAERGGAGPGRARAGTRPAPPTPGSGKAGARLTGWEGVPPLCPTDF